MSILTPEDRNAAEQLISPVEEQEVFETAPRAAFYVGLIATGDTVNMPEAFLSAGQLRAQVYVDELQFLPPSAKLDDGTEWDSDDSRSRHYGVLENRQGESPVIATMRAITKRHKKDLLPAERLFPEAFGTKRNPQAPIGAIEASRFISRHENKRIQSAAAISLIRAVVTQAYIHANEPIYAVVEQPLYQFFSRLGIPLEEITKFKPIPYYNNTENAVLRFHPGEIIRATHEDERPDRVITPYFRSTKENHGLGYYDEALINPIDELLDDTKS